jgi:hypothetical protein
MTRTFTDSLAVRSATPLWVGLVGPSFSGKTFSALRLATGMQRVSGGDVFVVDTEARRALHYAEQFVFRHVPFEGPYSPDDYVAAFEHCVKRGAKVIVTDSFSHVWEGLGGVLEQHDAEVQRRAKGDDDKAERVKMAAWIEPKAKHRRMVNAMLTMPVSFIICLRAKEKLRIQPGKKPEPRGWMPIASDELVFELTLKCLLLPGSDGVPTWHPEYNDEKQLIKLPQQFREMFKKPEQLNEDVGERLAAWAAGSVAATSLATEIAARYARCQDDNTLASLEHARRELWPNMSKDEKALLKLASEQANARLAEAARVATGGGT